MKYLNLIALILLSNFVSASKINYFNELKGDLSLVTEIDLSNKGLSEFPKEILECNNLVKLNLSNNGIMSIPIELAELTELKELNFSFNQGLSVLDLDEVLLLAKFKLEDLNLSDCDLFFLPQSIESQSTLVTLNLANNRLFKLPYAMMTFSELEDINISNNNIKDISWIATYWWSLKKINVADNKEFLTSALLQSLSYFDELDKIVIGKIDYIPSEFSFLSVNELIIKNSFIDYFPRTENSGTINKLIFDNCIFKDPEDIADKINSSCQPDYLGFKNIPATKLLPFLSVETDSISVKEAGLINLTPLLKVENLSWLDIRGNNVVKTSLKEFQSKKPEIKLLFLEPLKANYGVKPPIEKYVQKPIKKIFKSDKNEEFQLGKSILTVPENSILDANGNVYKGEINLEYSEFSSPIEVFLSGITMTSTVEGETMMLSSGGMIKLEATDDNGNALKVNPENPIKIAMFTENTESSMDFWKLNSLGSWEKLGTDSIIKPFKVDRTMMDSVINQDFKNIARTRVQFISDRYLPNIRRNRKLGTFEINFEELPTNRRNKKITLRNRLIAVPDHDYSAKFLCGKTFVFDGDSTSKYFEYFSDMKYYCKKQYKRLRLNKKRGGASYSERGPNFISELSLIPDFDNDRFDLSFKFKNELVKVPVMYKPMETNANSAIRDMRTFYKEYVIAEKKTIKTRRRLKIKLRPFLYKQELKLKKIARQMEVRRQMALYTGSNNIEDLTGQGSVQREFMLNGFGIFNCDQRSRMKNPKTIAENLIHSESREEIDAEFLTAMLIDHSTNGTMQYYEGQEIFLDDASKSTIVFFFTATIVGIYQSWRHNLTRDRTEVQMLDISEMSKQEFVQNLIYNE